MVLSSAYLPSTWERPLLERAQEAFHSGYDSHQASVIDRAILTSAYQYCAALTAQHSRSFYLASSLLPAGKRQAMQALYAFCRIADDLVDQPGTDAATTLADWRQRALASEPPLDDPVALAWADARRRYRLPIRYAEQLLEGVARDLRPVRYQTFAELAAYAYGVASTVGLMSMHIVGFKDRRAIPYAVKLGVALQVTNILRDVGEDWRAGRVYLPVKELAGFELSEADLAAGRVDRRWRAFMRFQVARNRRLYAEAWPGIAWLHPDGRLAIAAAADFYAAILDDIEAHDYDVFTRRAHLSALSKLRRLPGLWRQVRAGSGSIPRFGKTGPARA